METKLASVMKEGKQWWVFYLFLIFINMNGRFFIPSLILAIFILSYFITLYRQLLVHEFNVVCQVSLSGGHLDTTSQKKEMF